MAWINTLCRSSGSLGSGREKRLVRRKSSRAVRPGTPRSTKCVDGKSNPLRVTWELTTTRRLSSSISFYKTLMGIRSVEAISDHELKLEYDLAPESSNRHVALTLVFDPLTKRMIDARVSPSPLL